MPGKDDGKAKAQVVSVSGEGDGKTKSQVVAMPLRQRSACTWEGQEC